MSRILLILAAGTPVVVLDGTNGVLSRDTEIDFGEISHDVLAQKFAQANRQDLMPLLTHRNDDGRLVKYNPLGNPIEVTPEQEEALTEFVKVDDAIEEGLAEAAFPDISDSLAEKVARSTDAITSPSELAEELGVPVDELDDIAGSNVPPKASEAEASGAQNVDPTFAPPGSTASVEGVDSPAPAADPAGPAAEGSVPAAPATEETNTPAS